MDNLPTRGLTETPSPIVRSFTDPGELEVAVEVALAEADFAGTWPIVELLREAGDSLLIVRETDFGRLGAWLLDGGDVLATIEGVPCVGGRLGGGESGAAGGGGSDAGSSPSDGP